MMKTIQKATTNKASKKPIPKAKAKKPAPIPRKAKDNSREIAFASDGKLNTDQVRVLRTALRPCRMVSIKAAFGLSPEQKYSGKFLNNVHQLQSSGMVKVEKDQDSRAFVYTTTAKGKLALERATKEAKAQAAVTGK